jgi:hypothetical protein
MKKTKKTQPGVKMKLFRNRPKTLGVLAIVILLLQSVVTYVALQTPVKVYANNESDVRRQCQERGWSFQYMYDGKFGVCHFCPGPGQPDHGMCFKYLMGPEGRDIVIPDEGSQGHREICTRNGKDYGGAAQIPASYDRNKAVPGVFCRSCNNRPGPDHGICSTFYYDLFGNPSRKYEPPERPNNNHSGGGDVGSIPRNPGDEYECLGTLDSCVKQNPITQKVQFVINLLAAGIGIIVTAMIVIGAIQYSASGGDPQVVAAAKKKITNAVLALIAFMFMYSFLQWLVPGGIF